jgi:diacylglycerol diphosphate phosphatase/phosphatidate phosphatase
MEMERRKHLLVALIISTVILAGSIHSNPRTHQVNIDYPGYKKPPKKDTVSMTLCSFIFVVCPFSFFIAYGFISSVSTERKNTIFLALITVFILNLAFTELIKRIVSRPRPDYVSRCLPDTKGKCTGNPKLIHKGLMSFPSGHTSLSTSATSSFIYLAYLIQLNVILALILSVILSTISFLVAVSRVMDHKHHLSDVISGGVLGILVGIAVIHFSRSSLKKPR